MATAGSILGNPVVRREDPGILRGDTRYLDDLAVPGAAHVVFVRSTIAHGRISGIDASEAAGMPGVVTVVTADGLELPDHQGFVLFPPTLNRPPLARDTVRFVGDIVAAVVAETRAQAVDAAEMVVVDYDELPALVDPEAALAPGAAPLHPGHGSNVVPNPLVPEDAQEGVLADAEVVVEGRFVNQRLAAVPMEPNGVLVVPEGDGLTAWVTTQAPHSLRAEFATAAGLEPEQVRIVAPAVGGGFGAKMGMYVEYVIVTALARRLGRPVRWSETRSENMLAMVHGRAQIQKVRLGLRRDGTIVGLEVDAIGDAGAYPAIGAFLLFFTRMMASGVYRIPKVRFNGTAVTTNTTPTASYRGAGRPEATCLLERILDMAATDLGLDPVELRRRNFIGPEAFPFTTTTGAVYDNGDYAKALDAVLAAAGYDELRAEQAARRARGDRTLLGIGVSSYVEITAPGTASEFGSVRIDPDGGVTAAVGTSSHGQGHETAFAMLLSDQLGVPMEQIRILQSDTALVPRGTGTMGSRSLQIGGTALYRAGEVVLDKARRLAAHLLEANPDDVVVGDGGLEVAGVPASRLSWADLAAAADDDARRPDDMEPGLAHEGDVDQGAQSFPFGAHVAVVEVDADTGRVTPVRHVAVDDCGRILNPLLVAGQQQGGIAQGLAQALYEEMRFDADGNPVTANLMDYAIPSAAEMPSFETHNTETPTHLNPLGAKGIGESGTIGATAAVHNAVVDAVAHLGVRHIDMPCTAEKVWRAIQSATDA